MHLGKLAAALLLPWIFLGTMALAQQPQPAIPADPSATPQPSPQSEPQPEPVQSAEVDFATPLPEAPAPKASASGHYVRSMPGPLAALEEEDGLPFHSVTLALSVNTLGAGLELVTPIAFDFKLRSGINALTFNIPISIHGVNYDTDFHLKSSTTSVDWYPKHFGFRVSPGIMYSENAGTATASVGAGRSFVLGGHAFINSVDDPVHGNMSVTYPHKINPMVTVGSGNLFPYFNRRFTVPFEIGFAYTGAPQLNVNLVGTACTNQGCVSFAQSADAQANLKQEVNSLNGDLSHIPIYPIASLGFAYRF